MNGIRIGMGIALVGLAMSALAETGRVEVLSDRLNLRAKPRDEAEVAGQVNTGAILEFRGTNGNWVGVSVPTNVGLWVASEFIKDNVAQDKLNVRAGAGINYPAVGLLMKSEVVKPRSQMGQWMEIEPPSNAVLWLHKDYVKVVVEEAAPVAVAVTEKPTDKPAEKSTLALTEKPVEKPTEKPAEAAVVEEPGPMAPPDLVEQSMVPLPAKGEPMEFEGELRKTSILDFGRISNYCLMDWSRGRPTTACYIRGNNAQLKEFEGKRLRIKGDGYWVKNSAKPIVVPRQITPLVVAP